MHENRDNKREIQSTRIESERVPSSFERGRYVVVDKPLNWTSFDVVNKLRYQLSKSLGIKRIKVGHAGTLDPLATGVVVVCTGKSTKTIDDVQKGLKVYETTIRLGETTPSYDLETEPNAKFPYTHITLDLVESTLHRFLGEIDQIPPLFSAININGTRAYKLARKGEETDLPSKRVYIQSIKILNFDLPDLKLEIVCGKGTYIRSLARDLGEALGSGAHLTYLRRKQVGEFTLDGAIKVDDIEKYIQSELEREKYQK